MRRREFIAGAAGVAVARPLAVRAQGQLPVVGFLHSESPDSYARFVAAFRQGLAEAGYTEGRNVTIEYHWADGHYERLPAFVADLVRRRVNIIFANSPAALPAKAATTTIPIVFTSGFDPVEGGLVLGLAHPGGNVTGASILNVAVGQKRLELLRECVPSATTVGVLINPANRNAALFEHEVDTAARALGITVHTLDARTEPEIDKAFSALKQIDAQALLIGPDPFFNSHSARLATLAVGNRVPAIFQYREFAAAGGLMSYGGSITEAYRWGGIYTGHILGGADPANLPIQQVTTFELIINLTAARVLGLSIPPSLLASADEVIE